jgi:hypothetical protein
LRRSTSFAAEQKITQFEKGKRSSVKWVRNTPTPSHQWHELKVRIDGAKVEGFLDGKLYLEHTLAEPICHSTLDYAKHGLISPRKPSCVRD